MEADKADREAIMAYYQKIKEDNPDQTRALAAMQAILQFLEANRMETISEFDHRCEICRKALIETESKHSSIKSAFKLFRRFITLVRMDDSDFQSSRQNMIKRGHMWVNKMANSKKTIAKLAEPFIPQDSCVLTHSYSRVVMEAFRAAVDNGKTFKVYVTESQPDKSGLRTAKELREMGITCTVILDSAVGYIMPKVFMVIVGAENLLKNGGIFNKIGTYTIALAAEKYNKPMYVFAESLKFTEFMPLDQGCIPLDLKYKIANLDENEKDESHEDEHPLIDYTPPSFLNRLISDIGVLPPHAILDEILEVYH